MTTGAGSEKYNVAVFKDGKRSYQSRMGVASRRGKKQGNGFFLLEPP